MRRAVVILAVAAALFGVVQVNEADAGTIWRDFSFDGCAWRNTAVSLAYADSETYDRNGGCRYLDADLKYLDGSVVKTKSCPTSSHPAYTHCRVDRKIHHQSSGRASSWETDQWQVSGWWG